MTREDFFHRAILIKFSEGCSPKKAVALAEKFTRRVELEGVTFDEPVKMSIDNTNEERYLHFDDNGILY